MNGLEADNAILIGQDILGEDDHTDGDIPGDKDDDDGWYGLPLDKKWEDFMKRLVDGEVHWDNIEEEDKEVRDPSTTTRVLKSGEKELLAATDPRDKTSPTALHRLAVDFDTWNFKALPAQTRLAIIEYLLQHRKVDSTEDPVLTRAMDYDNFDFINFILQNCLDSLPGLLDATDNESANCLHYVFKAHFLVAVDNHRRTESARKAGKSTKDNKRLDLTATIRLLTHFVEHATPQCIAARDHEGNTPIHYALEYKNCRVRSPQYVEIVSQLIKKGDAHLNARDNQASQFNNRGESPYRYFERTRQEFLSTLAKRSQTSTQSNNASSVTRNIEKSVKPGAEDTRGGKVLHNLKGGMDASHKGSKSIATKGKLEMSTIPNPVQERKEKPRKDFDMDLKEAGRMYAPSDHGLTRKQTSGHSDPKDSWPAVESKGIIYTSPLERVSGSSQAGDSVADRTLGSQPMTQKQGTQGSLIKPGEESEGCKTAAENIRRLLKLHYIRSRPEMEAKELLYGKAALDRNFYFDATHLRGRSPGDVADLIRMLADPGGFEDTLSYVSIPALSYTPDSTAGSNANVKAYSANQGRRRETDDQDDKPRGRTSAVAVFDELARAGVRNILRLTVEDMQSPPHTDASIERAIRGEDSRIPKIRRQEGGFDVEVWDWQKFDLDTDVIRHSAPKVVEVNLYWSGNQTILKGWACNEGIPRLYQESGKELRRVTIHWSSGFEGQQRCESLLADFKKEVEKRTSEMPPGVAIQYKKMASSKVSGNADDNHPGPSTPGGSRSPPDHSWIETMENFRKALMTVHAALPNDIKPERIKVALIDDGIDRTRLLTYNNRVEVTGMSYCTNTSRMAPQNPSWHQSTHGHGTIMASSIVRVNPWVFLYVMRIQDEIDVISRKNGGIRIHAESAAKAIEGAITAGVKIISISWTIRDIANQDNKTYPDHEREAIKALKKAIEKAKEANILIFCSASDDIQKKGIDTLPYSHASNYIFRIGAADAYGWSDKQTEDHSTIDWFFPGNQVADDVNPHSDQTGELIKRDGSSIATALAAGLASLVLYLANILKEHHRADPKIANKYSEYAERLCQRHVMKKAFDNMITDENYRDKKFLPVWDLFGKRSEKIQGDSKNGDAKWDALAELCTKLVA